MTSTTWRENNESRLVDQLLTRNISFQNQMLKVQLMLNPTNPKYVNFSQRFFFTIYFLIKSFNIILKRAVNFFL